LGCPKYGFPLEKYGDNKKHALEDFARRLVQIKPGDRALSYESIRVEDGWQSTLTVDSRMGQKLWPATYPQGRSFVGDVVRGKKKGGAEGSAAEKFWQDPDVKKIYPVLPPSNKMASKTTARELRRLNRTLERGVRIVASRQQQAHGPAH